MSSQQPTGVGGSNSSSGRGGGGRGRGRGRGRGGGGRGRGRRNRNRSRNTNRQDGEGGSGATGSGAAGAAAGTGTGTGGRRRRGGRGRGRRGGRGNGGGGDQRQRSPVLVTRQTRPPQGGESNTLPAVASLQARGRTAAASASPAASPKPRASPVRTSTKKTNKRTRKGGKQRRGGANQHTTAGVSATGAGAGAGAGAGGASSRTTAVAANAAAAEAELGEEPLSARLSQQLANGSYDCMICLSPVSRKSAVWSCGSCWAIFHVNCLNQWRKRGTEGDKPGARTLKWRCPGCLRISDSKAVQYRCWCGRITNPTPDPYLVPHSCGETCGRTRGGGCPHHCDSQCHPGPCPPCSSLGPLRTCGCGRSKYRLRCGSKDPRKGCGVVCGKVLACHDSSHRCTRLCHDGPCPPCDKRLEQSCYCGRHTSINRCGSGTVMPRSNNLATGETPPDCALAAVSQHGARVTVGIEPELYRMGAPEQTFANDDAVAAALQNLLGLFRANNDGDGGDAVAAGGSSNTSANTNTNTASAGGGSGGGGGNANDGGTDGAEPSAAAAAAGGDSDDDGDGGGGNSDGGSADNPQAAATTPTIDSSVRVAGKKGSKGQHYSSLSSLALADTLSKDGAGEGYFSCGTTCNAWLDCGKHRCEAPCHGGNCAPCERAPERVKWCPCGSTMLTELQTQPRESCLDPIPTCARTCGRLLACGLHKCERKCHTGPCGLCEAVVPVKCRCSFNEHVFMCDDVARVLRGEPTAAEEAHAATTITTRGALVASGNSAAAAAKFDPSAAVFVPGGGGGGGGGVTAGGGGGAGGGAGAGAPERRRAAKTGASAAPARRSRKRASSDTVPAGPTLFLGEDMVVYYRCQRRCRRRLRCSNHRCARLCCPWSNEEGARLAATTLVGMDDDPEVENGQGPGHLCTRVCHKPLACGNHTCPSFCHLGHCDPCTIISMEPIACACGATVTEPPILCGTRPPQCSKLCSKPRACGHPHGAWHTCHEGECPPCTHLVAKYCAGKHELRQSIPCSQTDVKCGRRCGKPLPCRAHRCQRSCHAGACLTPQQEAELQRLQAEQDAVTAEEEARGRPAAHVRVRMPCNQKCGAQRRRCGHKCAEPCHAGGPCPDKPCREKVKVYCKCGRLSSEEECLIGGELSPEILELEEQLKHRTLPCDAQCEQAARVRDLAKALGIDPARRQRGQGVCPYPDHLLLFAATNPIVAGRVERRMLEVARDPHKDGVNLPPMPAAQRAFVHDLAQVYHLRSASYDPEPKRYTRVSRPDSAEQQPGAPTMTLKQAVAKFGTSASAGVGPQRMHSYEPDMSEMKPDDVGAVLHLHGLRKSATPQRVMDSMTMLAEPRTYRLRWLDEHNALATFDSVARARRAMHLLSTGLGGASLGFKLRYWGVGVAEHMASLNKPKRIASRPTGSSTAAAVVAGGTSGGGRAGATSGGGRGGSSGVVAIASHGPPRRGYGDRPPVTAWGMAAPASRRPAAGSSSQSSGAIASTHSTWGKAKAVGDAWGDDDDSPVAGRASGGGGGARGAASGWTVPTTRRTRRAQDAKAELERLAPPAAWHKSSAGWRERLAAKATASAAGAGGKGASQAQAAAPAPAPAPASTSMWSGLDAWDDESDED